MRVVCKRSPLCAYLPCCPRFTFWLTFFQSYMIPLFFSGLLSYLVGMKRRTRDNYYFLYYILISLDVQGYLLVNRFEKVICCLYSSVDCFHIW